MEYPPIEDVLYEDREWITPIHSRYQALLGNFSFNTILYRYFNYWNPNEHIAVIRPYAYAHYLVRRDGWKTLYEIAVHPDATGQGFGRRLVEYIGVPCRIKTNADNYGAQEFYNRLGFVAVDFTVARSGAKLLVMEKAACAA